MFEAKGQITLPGEGVAWYRTRYEVEAERALAEAATTFRPRSFEDVYERFFLTRAAGRATPGPP